MPAWLAGAYAGADPRRSRAALESLADARSAQVVAAGPFQLAFGGESRAQGGTCAIAGNVVGADALARELGLPGDAAPENAILAGFRRFGPGVLERLRGTFALALWDDESATGLLGQDLIAIAATFVAETPGGLAFASELRDLLDVLPSQPGPDDLTVACSLAGDVNPRGRTLFDGVRRLTGGSCVLLEGNRARTVDYWEPRYEGTLHAPREELEDRLRDQLRGAVRRAAGGADRVGVMLSGGLDSSMVTAVAADLELGVGGYSAVFPNQPELDESRYVDDLAEKWGFRVCQRTIEPRRGFEVALDYLAEWRLPVLGIGYLLERPLLGQMATDGVGVVLDGQGGDELFGADPLLAPSLLRRGRLWGSVSTLLRWPHATRGRSPRNVFGMWKGAAVKPALPLPLLRARENRRGPAPSPPWLAASARDAYSARIDAHAWRSRSRGPLWWRWLADALLTMPAQSGRTDYLRQRAGMAGLDAGSPLLDVDLALLILKTPPQLAYDPKLDRPLARAAMRGLLPESIRGRTDKSNLSSFYRAILTGPDLRWTRRVLDDPACEVYDYVDRELMRGLLDSPPTGDDMKSGMLLGALHNATMIQCWLRQLTDRDYPAQLLAQAAQDDGALAGARP